MNLLERIPTRWLLTGAALACLALWAAPSVAQSSGDPVSGKLLFEDTPNESGNNQLANACTNCHTVQNRRSIIATGSLTSQPFADITYEAALGEFMNAMNIIPAMNQYRPTNGLSTEQVADIAAYIADTPKITATGLTTSPNALAFSSSASGVAVTKSLTINHSVATTSNLQVTGVSLAAGTTAFSRTSACNTTTLSPSGTCTFSVTYTPTSTTAESRTLTISMQQGSVMFTRTVNLNGSVAGATPPPAPAGDDSGGGALGWAWLSGLALATAVLARRRRA
jgi:cytochrome c553